VAQKEYIKPSVEQGQGGQLAMGDTVVESWEGRATKKTKK